MYTRVLLLSSLNNIYSANTKRRVTRARFRRTRNVATEFPDETQKTKTFFGTRFVFTRRKRRGSCDDDSPPRPVLMSNNAFVTVVAAAAAAADPREILFNDARGFFLSALFYWIRVTRRDWTDRRGVLAVRFRRPCTVSRTDVRKAVRVSIDGSSGGATVSSRTSHAALHDIYHTYTYARVYSCARSTPTEARDVISTEQQITYCYRCYCCYCCYYKTQTYYFYSYRKRVHESRLLFLRLFCPGTVEFLFLSIDITATIIYITHTHTHACARVKMHGLDNIMGSKFKANCRQLLAAITG